MRGERQLPARPVMITVDDAYEDFAEHARPSLRRLGLPVTLFVPTAYPGDPTRRFWWDRLSHALRTSPRQVLEAEGVRHDLGDQSSRLATFRRLRALVKATAHGRAMADGCMAGARRSAYPMLRPVCSTGQRCAPWRPRE